MKPAPLVVVLLPLLFGGCGEKESVTVVTAVEEKQQEVKPTEEAPVLKYETEGDAVTITGCDKKPSGALTIPAIIEGNPVTSIGGYAFLNCTKLTSITIGDNVTSIGDWAFAHCSSLTSIAIADSVTSIGGSAFYKCSSLTSITIPDGVTSIGGYAFKYCTSLTSITIPDGVTSIEQGAFSGCSRLTSITIADSVTIIEGWAFAECRRLTAVIFLGDAPKAGWKDVFKYATSTIYRKPEAKGWGETFAGRPVKLISEKPAPPLED